jgi:hypothetical protein
MSAAASTAPRIGDSLHTLPRVAGLPQDSRRPGGLADLRSQVRSRPDTGGTEPADVLDRRFVAALA